MTAPRLVTPSREYAVSYAEALREGLYLDEDITEEAALVETDFDKWLSDKMDMEKLVDLPDGTKVKKVPATYFWLVSGHNRFLGAISFRHQLNDNLMRFGGHIGYSVRASERRKGYASLMLQGVLKTAQESGYGKVLITCRDDNMGSIKVIEKAGGVLENKVDLSFHTVPQRRYWVTL